MKSRVTKMMLRYGFHVVWCDEDTNMFRILSFLFFILPVAIPKSCYLQVYAPILEEVQSLCKASWWIGGKERGQRCLDCKYGSMLDSCTYSYISFISSIPTDKVSSWLEPSLGWWTLRMWVYQMVSAVLNAVYAPTTQRVTCSICCLADMESLISKTFCERQSRSQREKSAIQMENQVNQLVRAFLRVAGQTSMTTDQASKRLRLADQDVRYN